MSVVITEISFQAYWLSNTASYSTLNIFCKTPLQFFAMIFGSLPLFMCLFGIFDTNSVLLFTLIGDLAELVVSAD